MFPWVDDQGEPTSLYGLHFVQLSVVLESRGMACEGPRLDNFRLEQLSGSGTRKSAPGLAFHIPTQNAALWHEEVEPRGSAKVIEYVA